MTEFIAELFSKIFNDNVVLATIFVSMVPIMELKGGIPFGMSKAFWGNNALSRWSAFWSAFLGCSIVVVVLYFTFVPIMKFLRKTKVFKGLANFIDSRINQKTQDISKLECESDEADGKINSKTQSQVDTRNQRCFSKQELYKMLGVFIFVAIPLPLTGVWMGTCIAVAIGLNFWKTAISAILGNLVAGIIISTICVMFPQFTHWLIYIFLILVVVVIIVEIIKHKIGKK